MRDMKDINNNNLQIGDFVVLTNCVEEMTRTFEIWKVLGDGTYAHAPKRPMAKIEGLYSGKTDVFNCKMLKKIDVNKIMKGFTQFTSVTHKIELRALGECYALYVDDEYITTLNGPADYINSLNAEKFFEQYGELKRIDDDSQTKFDIHYQFVAKCESCFLDAIKEIKTNR